MENKRQLFIVTFISIISSFLLEHEAGTSGHLPLARLSVG
jgi:hypothetical protein